MIIFPAKSISFHGPTPFAPAVCRYYQHDLPGKKAVPGAVIAIQTFGDFLGFNPHGHVLVTDGCFPERGLFKVAPAVG